MTDQSRARKYRQRDSTEKQRRKTVPLWLDQWDDLTPLARDLQRGKSDPDAPRITDNTLARVAIDVLLEYAHLLAGDTEDELRTSLLTGLSGSRTDEDSK